jgi:2-polyprenyl-3-methyl-5-hydroxy-6-metoxy-1,4-benzoquinol methylase
MEASAHTHTDHHHHSDTQIADNSAVHQGHHHHHHLTSQGITNANREYFDKIAAEYENPPGVEELAQRVTTNMRTFGSWNPNQTTVLDFACGTGLISQFLEPHCKQLIGVDLSPVMIGRYNKKAADSGVVEGKMIGMVAELKGDPSELDGQKFDFVVCSAAYHHFESIVSMTKILTSFLKPGTGRLLIADFFGAPLAPSRLPESFPAPPEAVIPHTHGFTEDQIRSTFVEGGLEGFEWKDIGTIEVMGRDLRVFVAQGIRPAASS